MTWCNLDNPSTSTNNINTNTNTNDINNFLISEKSPTCFNNNPFRTISCPSCSQHVPLHHHNHKRRARATSERRESPLDNIRELPLLKPIGDRRGSPLVKRRLTLFSMVDVGYSHEASKLKDLPAGVKFDPTDTEILRHLDAKIKSDFGKLHPFLDDFIPTIQAHNGICYTHPHKLPGVRKDGIVRHFFHFPSKAYTTGTRKRRKVLTDEDSSETRWHKTGKTRPIFVNGTVKGFKKILVLYTNYGRQKKPEKTNWVMHQYHLGKTEDENDGDYVLSKVVYRTQPRQCGSNVKETVKVVPLIKTPLNCYQPHYIPYDHGVSGQVTSSEIEAQLVGNTPLLGDGSLLV